MKKLLLPALLLAPLAAGAIGIMGTLTPRSSSTPPDPGEIVFSLDMQAETSGSYALDYGENLGSTLTASVFTTAKGADNGTNTWNATQVNDGMGPSGGNYMLYDRWADVDGAPNAGYYWNLGNDSGGVVPDGGWDESAPLYLRWRMHVTSHMENTAGGAAMKWIIFGGPEPGGGDTNPAYVGNSRIIVFFYSAEYINTYSGGSCNSGPNTPGITDEDYTALVIGAGVSGTRALGFIPNNQDVDVQLAVRYGVEGTFYMRAYIDNNDINSPDYFKDVSCDLDDDTWVFPSPSLSDPSDPGEYRWGNIVSDNSETPVNFQAEFNDHEMGTGFDAGWDE